MNDADALDARLNEIARNNGTPNTRPGHHDRPDVRTGNDDGTCEADSLMATADEFHRRVAAAHSHDVRASTPDPQLWETIMANTSTPAPPSTGTSQATANPWTAPPPSHDERAGTSRAPGAARAVISHRQHIWNMAANIGLVIAILLAGFGIWRISGEPGLPGGAGNDPETPQFAMQPSTPIGTPGTSDEPVSAPSVATPQPTTACNFSEAIPIFNGVDESPWDGTAVLLTTAGDVVLTCPEEPEGVVLMRTSPHGSVSPLAWPGVVLIPSYGEKPEAARTRVLNLFNGEVAELGFRNVGVIGQAEEGHTTPWYVGPAVDNASDFAILDLRTMEHRQLSDLAGASVPEESGIMMSTSETGATLVLGLMSRSTVEGNGTLITNNELPGDLLVLHGSLDAATWIPIPDDFPSVIGFDVSPDGSHIALHGATDQMSQDREDVYSLVRLRDGKEIERSSALTGALDAGEGVWLQRGKVFAYIDGNKLMILPLVADMPEQPVFEADGPLSQLRVTADESTVLVLQTGPEEIATMTALGQPPRLYAVNTATQQATMFPGLDVSDNVGWETPPDRFLVTFEYQQDLGDTITYQVIDAVTGETAGTLNDIPVNDPHGSGYPYLGRASVAESPDGSVEIVSFDSLHTYLIQVRDGEYRIERIEPPEGIIAETSMTLSMYFSPSGEMVAMNGEADESGAVYLLDVAADVLAWQPIGAAWEGGYLPFVPGTGALPEQKPELGFDFSEAPDGTGVLDHDGLAAALRATEDNFAWPAGYDPDVEAMIATIPDDNSRHQAGGEYTILGGYNQCAWYQTWLDARESGDGPTAAEAMYVMAEVIPYFPNHPPSTVEHLRNIAATAAGGDPSEVQQSVTVGCQGLYWE